MSKFIVIKFKSIIYILLSLFLIITMFFIINNFIIKKTAVFSINSISKSSTESDLTGDGIKDKFDFIESNGYIQIKVETFNGEYLLKNSDNNSNLFNLCSWYSLKPQYIDLTRSNINDIIISGVYDNEIRNHIFKWTNDSFINVYSSNKNVLGILNSNNSRSPIILDTNITNNTTPINCYILRNNNLKNITNNNTQIPGLYSITKFIDLIEYPYELTETPDIFTTNISSDELSLLWKLNKAANKYTFINCFFYDIDWDKSCSPSSIFWILSFKKNSLVDSNTAEEELTLYLQTSLDELSEHKISSIQK